MVLTALATSRSGPGRPAPLPAGELHVWHASLERSGPAIARLCRLLAVDELRRADRFRFDRDRSRYIAGRGGLRILLGRYLTRAPEEIRFEYGANEKPLLPQPALWFNVSHSGPAGLFAFTTSGEIGVDLELDDADFARERIAEQFFSADEVRALRSLPLRQQARAFLVCWTRKEAFIKARGDGLSLPLDRFDVNLMPGQPAALLRASWSSDEPREWWLGDLSDPDAGYVGAVAVRTRCQLTIKRRTFEIDDDETLT